MLESTKLQKIRCVENIKCYYNFQTNEKFEFITSVFSDLKNSFLLKYKDVYKEQNGDNDDEAYFSEETINKEDFFINFNTLKKKIKIIEE